MPVLPRNHRLSDTNRENLHIGHCCVDHQSQMLKAETTEEHYCYCDVSLFVMALLSHLVFSVGPYPHTTAT